MYPLTVFNSYFEVFGKPIELSWENLKDRFKRPAVRSSKIGTAISPARFSGERKNANVEQISLMVGDLDGDHDLEEIQRRISAEGVRTIIHTTFSHTPQHPKRRVIVPLSRPAPPDMHFTLWATLNSWCQGTLDAAAKDPSRMFLLPAVPNGEAFRNFTLDVKEGRDFDWGRLERIDQRADRNPPEGSIVANLHPDPSILTYCPSTRDEIETAEKMLEMISIRRADDYLDWIRVGLALYSLGDGAFRLWDTWSRTSEKYKEGETQKKWRTFKNSQLGMHSLIYWASMDSGRKISTRKEAA